MYTIRALGMATALTLSTTGLILMTGCEDDATPDTVEEHVEEAADNAEDAIEDAGDAIDDAVDDAGDAVDDAVNNLDG